MLQERHPMKIIVFSAGADNCARQDYLLRRNSASETLCLFFLYLTYDVVNSGASSQEAPCWQKPCDFYAQVDRILDIYCGSLGGRRRGCVREDGEKNCNAPADDVVFVKMEVAVR